MRKQTREMKCKRRAMALAHILPVLTTETAFQVVRELTNIDYGIAFEPSVAAWCVNNAKFIADWEKRQREEKRHAVVVR